MKNEDCFIWGILLGMIITAVLILALSGGCYIGDSRDEINVRALGEMMCAEHGMEYSHREIENRIPTIYCSDGSEEIEDGYLKKTSGANIRRRE